MKAFLKHFAVEVCALRSMLVGFAAFATLPTTTIFDFTELSFGPIKQDEDVSDHYLNFTEGV